MDVTKLKTFEEELVNCDLLHKHVDVASALSAMASQENADGNEYDIMRAAAVHIYQLRQTIRMLKLK